MRRDVFHAIADPTRREILNIIAHRSMTLNGVGESFDMTRQAISKHIKVLTESGLIVVQQQGRERYCHAKLDKLQDVSDWLEPLRRSIEHRFEKLDNLLADMKRKKKRT